MRKLVAIVAMVLIFSFSSLSMAADFMGLYTKPIVTSEVKDDIRGGKIEKDFMSFYFSPKETERTASVRTGRTYENDGGYIVFGVRVNFYRGS